MKSKFRLGPEGKAPEESGAGGTPRASGRTHSVPNTGITAVCEDLAAR